MNDKEKEHAISYLHGYFEAKIEAFAQSTHYSSSELTARLGALFLSSQSGEILGTKDSLPELRRKPAKRNKATRKMAMAKRTSSKTSYWAKMTPEERNKEVKRRREVAAKNRSNAKK